MPLPPMPQKKVESVIERRPIGSAACRLGHALAYCGEAPQPRNGAMRIAVVAPSCPLRRDAADAVAALREAKKKGVHVYPVASSDTDDTAEYQMRATAQMTGGRDVFLKAIDAQGIKLEDQNGNSTRIINRLLWRDGRFASR